MTGKLLPSSLLMLTLLVCDFLYAKSDDIHTEFSSGAQRVTLIELFTSEGCSSCPPADRWLSNLKSDPDLWKKFTPIAFHVDYWDYIGWSDRFAQAAFGVRQRRYADEGGARVVYTPGVFRGGSDWRGWRTGESPSGADENVGVLTVRIDGDEIIARFDAQRKNPGELAIHFAILGMNLETRVGAGENVGRTLHHDFVALTVVSEPLEKGESAYIALTRLPDSGAEITERVLVAWVSDLDNQLPIQSVGGFLPNH